MGSENQRLRLRAETVRELTVERLAAAGAGVSIVFPTTTVQPTRYATCVNDLISRLDQSLCSCIGTSDPTQEC